jgi:hypothetical protein
MDRNVELALGYRVTAIKEAPSRPAGSTRAVLEVEHASADSSKPADIEADLVLWTVRSLVPPLTCHGSKHALPSAVGARTFLEQGLSFMH